jgi:hypothetical protein
VQVVGRQAELLQVGLELRLVAAVVLLDSVVDAFWYSASVTVTCRASAMLRTCISWTRC